jgi:hypothetical protein
MAYIPPTNKKEAKEYRKFTMVMLKVSGVMSLCSFIAALITSDWDYVIFGLVILFAIPLFKFIDWLEHNNASQMEETDNQSK